MFTISIDITSKMLYKPLTSIRYIMYQFLWIRGRSVSILTRLMAGRPGYGSLLRHWSLFFPFATVSIPAMWPTHNSIQWVQGAPSTGLKRPGSWSWSLTSCYGA